MNIVYLCLVTDSRTLKISQLIIVTSKVENKIAGCLMDFQGLLGTMCVNNKYKEKRNATVGKNKFDKIISWDLWFNN